MGANSGIALPAATVMVVSDTYPACKAAMCSTISLRSGLPASYLLSFQSNVAITA